MGLNPVDSSPSDFIILVLPMGSGSIAVGLNFVGSSPGGSIVLVMPVGSGSVAVGLNLVSSGSGGLIVIDLSGFIIVGLKLTKHAPVGME